MFEALVIAAMIAIVGLTLVCVFLILTIKEMTIIYKSKNLKEYVEFVDNQKVPKAKPIPQPEIVEIDL